MRKQSVHSNSSDHIHLHYHYYFPEEMRSSQIGDTNNRSKASNAERKQYEFVTPKEKNSGKMKTEGNQDVSAFTEFKKMQMSDLWPSRQLSARHLHELPSHNFMARSVLEESFDKGQQSTEPIGNDSFMKKSIHTVHDNEPSRELLAYYQQQLLKCKAEISRLKMVEQECQYLRDAFYTHYTEKCPNK